MNDSDLRQRLDALIAALAPPPVALPATGDPADSAGAAIQRIATTQVDELLRRVAALTGILGADADGWSDIDRLAAQLLLADLSAVTSTARALNQLAASRLATALADLRAAGIDVQRTVQEASGS
jgi:hypothetical protein